ncbi:MAG: hypothetical protein HYX48_04030 [Chlamydiales bacterium]|nr:hypothetical protein [Chlamydiales bacterium]
MSTGLVASLRRMRISETVEQPRYSLARLPANVLQTISSLLAPGQEACRFAASYQSFGSQRYWITHQDLFRWGEELSAAAIKCQKAFPHARGFYLEERAGVLFNTHWAMMVQTISALPVENIHSLVIRIDSQAQEEGFAERPLNVEFIKALNAYFNRNRRITQLMLNFVPFIISQRLDPEKAHIRDLTFSLEEPFLSLKTVTRLRCAIRPATTELTNEIFQKMGENFPEVTHLTASVIASPSEEWRRYRRDTQDISLDGIANYFKNIRSLAISGATIHYQISYLLTHNVQTNTLVSSQRELRLFHCTLNFKDYVEERQACEMTYTQKLLLHDCSLRDTFDSLIAGSVHSKDLTWEKIKELKKADL